MNTVKFFNRAVLRPTYKLHVATQRQVNTDAIIDPPDRADIMIPKPKERKNETVEQRKARLIYQSRKRGMLENDLLLGTFVAKYLKTFNDSQLEEYDKLINGPSNDWDIYNWATEIKPTPVEYEHGVMKLLKEHCKNLNKESSLVSMEVKNKQYQFRNGMYAQERQDFDATSIFCPSIGHPKNLTSSRTS
ncbi:hypothetical protein GEV33_009786 [Tenebrio molitor]|uniref:Succinate dehydrogenase assembly factor 2, mitochondrial n=1 Tax=Tenebrio molitor TaxID=7067 RepID=A0A8J6LH27_TENMO|nr:hypothetical protein GEV33_009786 [Tenebrio molitor]